MAVQPVRNKFIHGLGASPGIILGKAFLVDRSLVRSPQKRISPEEVEKEVERFMKALQESQHQLMEIKERILDPEVRRHSFILDVHLMILDDQMLIQDTIDTIRKKKVNAEWALDQTIGKLDTAFNAIEDEYLKERRSDLHYVSARIFRNLQGRKHDDITKIKGNVIVVAHDLSPADTLQMNLKHVAGFVTDIGGKVSHTAILARSLGIPAVVGLDVATSLINGGDLLIIDGETGDVVINPTEEVSKSFLERKRRIKFLEREIIQIRLSSCRDPGWRSYPSAGQYRDGGGDPFSQDLRSGRGGSLPHGDSLSEPERSSHGRGAFPDLSTAGGGHSPCLCDHPDPRYRWR